MIFLAQKARLAPLEAGTSEKQRMIDRANLAPIPIGEWGSECDQRGAGESG